MFISFQPVFPQTARGSLHTHPPETGTIYLQLTRPHDRAGGRSQPRTRERQDPTPWRRGLEHAEETPWRGFGGTARLLSSRTAAVLAFGQVVGEDSGGRGVCVGCAMQGCEAHALGTSIMGQSLNLLWRQEVRHVFPFLFVWAQRLVWRVND